MRGGGGSRAPPQALYRPGSGPLRKSGRPEEFDNENNSHEIPKSTSIQYRLRNAQFPGSNESKNSSAPVEIDSVSSKFTDLHVNYKNKSNNHQGPSKSNHLAGDSRRRSKKPEQQLYVPKKVKETQAERDAVNR